MRPGFFNKLAQLTRTAREGKNFLDDNRLAHVETPERLEIGLEPPPAGIQVDTHKVERAGDFRGRKAGAAHGGLEAVGQEAQRNEVAAVMLANGRRELLDPGARDFRPGAVSRPEGNRLDVMEPGQFPEEPVSRFSRGARDDRLVHEVVTEYRGAAAAGSSDGLPEAGLGPPAVRFLQAVIPGRDLRFAIARQTGEVEIEARILRQRQEAGKLAQGAGVGLVRPQHELRELKMEAHHIGAQRFHLPEILRDGVPLRLPIILEQAHLVIPVVVETPRNKGLFGAPRHESPAVGGNPDPIAGRPRRAGRGQGPRRRGGFDG